MRDIKLTKEGRIHVRVAPDKDPSYTMWQATYSLQHHMTTDIPEWVQEWMISVPCLWLVPGQDREQDYA